ncbi:MAG TPA: outer membrane protein assembly factor BamA [Dongiaceae bacterium]|jgi:outer membrane protein insertion porin family|nr:outer membrane protein assembly factor BamA [Dongiaceae bacterium]
MHKIGEWGLALTLLVGSLFLWHVPLVHAQESGAFNGDPIQEIRVEGNQRIEPETIVNYMQLNTGDTFDPRKIDQALKNLFATGFFADVNLTREGNDLVVHVAENPVINRLAFEGNRKFDDGDLQKEVQLKPRTVYTQTKARADVKRILDLYRRSGRFAATVEPKVIKLDQNRVDLVFEINEGSVTKIARIDFVGNHAFDDGDLREQILTRESAFYRFLSNSDTYDPDRLNADKEKLRMFYLSEGYADFRVDSAVAELTPDRDAFFITFTVTEGPRYKFGKIDIKTTLRNLDVAALKRDLSTVQGDWYNATAVEETVQSLADVVGSLGYAFVDVRPRTSPGKGEHVLDLTYDIDEGQKVFIKRIEITGNVRTEDKVIRREFRFAEGDAFSTAKLKRTEQRLKNLQFFETVDIRPTPTDEPDKTVVKVKVKEQSTGALRFGAGFSTQDGPLGDIELRERNLLGKGQDLRAQVRISGRTSGASISFTDPYFLDKNILGGVDIFATRYRRAEVNYQEDSYGFALRTGYNISEYLSQGFNYRFSYDNTSNISSLTSRAILLENQPLIRSSIGQTLSYDRRDATLDTHNGYFVILRNEFVGVGGDVHDLRSELSGGYYYTPFSNITLSLTQSVGYIFSIVPSERVLVSDNYLLGGNDFRGFRTAGIGPFDEETDDRIGGKFKWNGTAQIAFPLGLPAEYQIRGRFFSDFGTLFGTDFTNYPGTHIFDDSYVRASVGGGLTWVSPFGPLGVDFGVPIRKKSYDKGQLFRFSVGTSF